MIVAIVTPIGGTVFDGVRRSFPGNSTLRPSPEHGRLGTVESADALHFGGSTVTSTLRARIVLLAGFAGVLAVQVPVACFADQLTGSTGGLLFILRLLAYEFIGGDGTANNRLWLVWGTTVVFYLGLYSVAALPTHLAFRSNARAHPIAIGIVSLLFIAAVALALPISGLPL